VTAFDAFFADIDGRWGETPSTPLIPLQLIGSSALMLQEPRYQRGTKDSDVWETGSITPTILEKLVRLAGRNSSIHRRHRMYLDVVRAGLPLLAQQPRWHPAALRAPLRNFDLYVLDVVDVVVSKLIRFNADDASDIQAMVDAGRVIQERLIERFGAAVDMYKDGADAWRLPEAVANLNRVERDMLGVDETAIDLPSWI
jgi:hypothetical protein